MAQLVEHHLAKVRVASSNLVVRSNEAPMRPSSVGRIWGWIVPEAGTVGPQTPRWEDPDPDLGAQGVYAVRALRRRSLMIASASPMMRSMSSWTVGMSWIRPWAMLAQ